MTSVVNIRKHPFDIYIGRAGKGHDGYFGNPYVVGKDGTRAEVLVAYSIYFEKRLNTDPEFAQRIEELRGKALGCFCVKEPWIVKDAGPIVCHGQVIADWLED